MRCGRSGVLVPFRFHVSDAGMRRAGFETLVSIFTVAVPNFLLSKPSSLEIRCVVAALGATASGAISVK